MNDKITRCLHDKRLLILLMAILGIILIIISTGTRKKETETEFDNAYGEYLEAKLENTLSSIEDIGEIDVMITFESSYEAIQTNYSEGIFKVNQSKENVIEKPLPKIAGVMIVCKALTSNEDFKAIKKATSTVLGINESKINIIGGNRS